MKCEPVRGLLIDVDGTLLDSNDAHARAWQDALLVHGRTFELAPIRSLIGKGGDKLLPELAGIDADSDEGKAISKLRGDRFNAEYLPTLRPTRGARKMLQKFAADGLQLIIATSSSERDLHALLAQAGVADLLPSAATSDDAKASKPDPDILKAALAKSGLSAEQVFMLGDTPYDLEAASKAGIPMVALRCGGHWTEAAFSGAAAVYVDPAALVEHVAELVFYPNAVG